MVKITACVITKNEENNIVGWLESMKRITRDLVVVDTGSEDHTVQIAKQYGAKVFNFQWNNDFSAAKNFAIDQAKGEWIVFLDADEYFTESSLKNLRKYIEIYHHKPNIDALVCKIINIDANDHNRFISEFYNLRMFRNKPELRYERPIHEMLEKSTGSLQTYILPDGVDIYHTGYSTAIIQAKLKRNLQILFDEIAETGEQRHHYRYLCECYNGLKEYEMAEKYAKLFIEKGERTFGTDNSVHKQLIGCMINLQRDEQLILGEIDKFIEKFPDDPELLWYKGELLFVKEDYMQAEHFLLQFIEQCEATKGRIEYGENSLQKKWSRAYYPLGIIAQHKGEKEQAVAYFQASLQRYRYNPLILDALLKALADYSQPEIIKILGTIYDNRKEDIGFLVDNIKQADFPALAYYNNMLGQSNAVQDDALREAGNHLAELYEVLVMAAMLSPLPLRENMLDILLPAVYQRVYHRLKGAEIDLAQAEEVIYHNIAHKLNVLKEEGAGKAVSREARAMLKKCLLHIAADDGVDENCSKLTAVCAEYQIQFGDLICFIDATVEEKTKVVLHIAMHLYQQGKTAETLRFMIAAMKNNPNDEDLLYALALFFKLSGDKASAFKLLASYKGNRSDLLALKSER